MRGEWVGERLEIGVGKSLFQDWIKGVTLEITGEEIVFKGADGKPPTKLKYRLRQDKSPKQIDVMDEKKVYEGIYKLEGEVLTIYIANYPDKKRPAQFKESPESNDYSLMVLKRKGSN